jgi:putative endonuclease
VDSRSTLERGLDAQHRAEAFLRRLGLLIVARNYRCEVGELDLIARQGDELIFVEVRSRADDGAGGASMAVGPSKQAQIARVAQWYVAQQRPEFSTCRFDVVAITGDELEHFVDAFRPGLP